MKDIFERTVTGLRIFLLLVDTMYNIIGKQRKCVGRIFRRF